MPRGKIAVVRAHSSTVEQFPLKEKVDGPNPSGLTAYLLHLAQMPVERRRPADFSFNVNSPFSITPPRFPKYPCSVLARVVDDEEIAYAFTNTKSGLSDRICP